MMQAGSVGIWQVLLIVVALFWLMNAYRRSRILSKIEDEVDRKKAENRKKENEGVSKSSPHRKRLNDDTAEADYEVIE